MKPNLLIEEAMVKAEEFEGETARALREFDEAWTDLCTVFWSIQPWSSVWSIAVYLIILLARFTGAKDQPNESHGDAR